MPSKLGKSLLTFALLVIAVISWQWIDDREVETQVQNKTIEMVENQSDYYLEDFEIVNIANSRDSTAGTTTAGRYLKITGNSLSHHFT